MESQHVRIYALTVGIILLSLTFANATRADSEQATRQFLLGTGVLCTLGIPDACPDIASASNGDQVLVTGSGKFTPGDDDASGGGTFKHMRGTTVVASGTWKAEELVSFKSFGVTPGVGEGGKAVLKVVLKSSSGLVLHGVLVIGCELGSPPAGAFEGITLKVFRVINFNTPVSGITIFLPSAED